MALTDSLISYWKLDEASGDAIDAHGSNDLTDTNTVGSTTGVVGNCRDFERGNSEYFSLADNADLSTGDIDYTLTAWFNPESLPGNYITYAIATKGTSTGNQREYTVFLTTSSGVTTLQVMVSSAGTAATQVTVTSSATPTAGSWFFVVIWHDSTANTINIQVNNGTVDSTSHSTGSFDGTGPFSIGSFGGFANRFDGLIDEVGFWKRVLTSQERTDLYNSGAGLAYPFSVATTNRRRRLLIAGRA